MYKEDTKELTMSDINCLDDALKLLQVLRQKMRIQAQQLLVWRRAYKLQEAFILHLQHENANQLRSLSSKLILFESRLIRKQKDISIMLNHRESIIHKQHKLISALNNKLIDNGLGLLQSDESDINTIDLNDSDSAVVMEELDTEILNLSRYGNDNYEGMTIARSVSDAINANLKCNIQRTSGYLKRPEVLETVYSVEEDADSEDENEEISDTAKKRNAFATSNRQVIYNVCSGSQNVPKPPDEEGLGCRSASLVSLNDIEETRDNGTKKVTTNQVITYNRVMSNHRSVTKPKDVKYKRINKAKSKSLEELRGRLKSWVEGGKLTGQRFS